MKLYIDPGTGSMLFSLALGLISVVWFGLRKLYLKVKYLTPGKVRTDVAKKDIVIYSEDKRYWTNFKGILDEFERRKIPVTYLAGSEDDPNLSTEYEYVEKEVAGLGNKAFTKLNFLNARICLATTPGLDVYQWKRSKNVDCYIHLTHSIGPGTGYRMFGTQFFDAVLLSSDVYVGQHREIEKKRNSAEKDIVSVGSPYMDYLLKRKALLPPSERNGNITVLLAPSWGASGILSRFGDKVLNALKDSGFDIIFRPHPQSYISEAELIAGLRERFPDSDRFHWNRDSDNFAVLSKADLLISDYSGIIYDYALVFERPVLYADVDFDYATYDSAWLDDPTSWRKTLEKIGQKLEEDKIGQLKTIIETMTGQASYRQAILEARDECWQHRGHAAERVADYVVAKLHSLNTEAGQSGNKRGGSIKQ